MMRHVAANVLTLLILGLVLVFGLIVWGQSQFRAAGPLETPLRFQVERGEGLGSVADKLAEAGAIGNASVFRIGARYSELEDGVKFGEYEFPAGASMEAILRQLNAGGNIARRVIVPEGWTSWQVVEALKARDDLTGEVTAEPSEGSLAPAGYDYQNGDSREDLLARMRALQEEIVAEAWAGRDPELPVNSPEELLILASLIEKETGVAGERSRIAGVFVNRLERGMRLQTDPTVIYGITKGRESLGRGLRQSELVQATPFNTYVIGGLPPTPIANPGREAIFAAANPEPTGDLYFVADGTGGHAFASTLEQHNANVVKWRRLEAQRAREAEEAAGAAGEEAEPGAETPGGGGG